LWKSTKEKKGLKGGVVKVLLIGGVMSLPRESRANAFQEFVEQGGEFDLSGSDVDMTAQQVRMA